MAHIVIVERIDEMSGAETTRMAINADRIVTVEPAEHGITIRLLVGPGGGSGHASRYEEVDVAEELDGFVARLR